MEKVHNIAVSIYERLHLFVSSVWVSLLYFWLPDFKNQHILEVLTSKTLFW